MATARTSAHDNTQLIDFLSKRLVHDALPGETDNFTPQDHDSAATLSAKALAERAPNKPSIASETGIDSRGRRIMRIAIANDDMPFLVDSVAATFAAHDVAIDRILHPVMPVERDGARLREFRGSTRESLIYLETERADARERRALLVDLETNLGHVRAAVADWGAMKVAMDG